MRQAVGLIAWAAALKPGLDTAWGLHPSSTVSTGGLSSEYRAGLKAKPWTRPRRVSLLVAQDDIPAGEGDPGDADLGIPADAVEPHAALLRNAELLLSCIQYRRRLHGV